MLDFKICKSPYQTSLPDMSVLVHNLVSHHDTLLHLILPFLIPLQLQLLVLSMIYAAVKQLFLSVRQSSLENRVYKVGRSNG